MLNFATDDSAHLIVQPGPSNGWTAPWADMASPTDGRIRVPPGFVGINTGVITPGALLLWGGNLTSLPVTATERVLRLVAAGSPLPYRVVLLGRTGPATPAP